MSPVAATIPQVNDLVGLVPGGIDDAGEAQCDAVPSRVEDVVTDSRTGEVSALVVAAPFVSDDARWIERDFCLRWLTPRGVSLLPVRMVAVEVDSGGLKQWRLQVNGPAHRDQRRRFARVPVHTPVEVTLPPAVERDGTTHEKGASDPAPHGDVIAAVTTDVSEGGMAVTSRGEPLAQDSEVGCTFAVGGATFSLTARVVRSVLEPAPGGRQVRTALQFVGGERETDELRKRLYQLQLENRRRELDDAPPPPPARKARRKLW